MKNIRYTTQYKKDLKLILNQPKKLKALQEVIDKLRNEETLDEKYRLHPLKGVDYQQIVGTHGSCIRNYNIVKHC